MLFGPENESDATADASHSRDLVSRSDAIAEGEPVAEPRTLLTDVVFGESADLLLLGARTLEGLNLRIDPVSKCLIDAGPMPLAAVG